jgi:hypothetical protein
MRDLLLREYSNRFPDRSISGAVLSFPELPHPMALTNYSGGMAWFSEPDQWPGGKLKIITIGPEELLNAKVQKWAGNKTPLMEGDWVWVGDNREKVKFIKEGDGSSYPIVTEHNGRQYQYKWSEISMVTKAELGEIIKDEQKKREDACPDHEYRNASYKWGSVNRMECIHCGKIIND